MQAGVNIKSIGDAWFDRKVINLQANTDSVRVIIIYAVFGLAGAASGSGECNVFCANDPGRQFFRRYINP